MNRRILFGVVAWLMGAGTATAGSLLAVSLLGEGITGTSGQLLTQSAVNRALAGEAAAAPQPASPAVKASAEPSPAGAATTPAPVTASASPVQPPPVTTTAPPPAPPSASSSPAFSGSPTSPASPGGAVLTSPGGDVVATCQAAGAYLVSWSPLQGYQVGDVARGPAAMARVTFDSHADHVTMLVSCSAGVPSATSRTSWGGDD